jgi:type III restriction enzyme
VLEPKARNELTARDVLEKKVVAEQWCGHASDHAKSYGGKPWEYALIPHDIVADNMTVAGLVAHAAGK